MNKEEITLRLNEPLFEIYYNYLIDENEKLNLTAITQRDDVYSKHFYDSVMIMTYLPFKRKKVLDIGAGAGFPSIPIKMIEPSVDLTIVDGLKKRIDFLNRLTQKLEIEVQCVHGRAEALQQWSTYDVILARAVGRLNVLVEMALPYLRMNGYFVAYKSIHYQEELKDAQKAIALLGGKVEKVVEYALNDELKHVYILIKKVKKTPKGYPRHFSKIKKKPL